MISKKLNQITREDLLGLIGRVRENKRFECKREIPRGDKGRLKLLAGVSALANTEGGDFLIGAATEQGLVTAVDGIEVADPDQHKQALEQQLAAQIEPPVAGIDIQEVECGDGRWAFVVRVPQSWLGPHREKLYNDFYVRTSTSTVALGVTELRSAFGLRDSGTERIEAFRRERLMKIATGQAPVRLRDAPAIVLHMAPLPSFANRDLIPIVNGVVNGSHFPLPLHGMGATNYAKINLLGVLNFPGYDQSVANAEGYGQLFRSGAYEGVAVASVRNDLPFLRDTDLANMIVGSVRRYLALQDHYDIAFPTFAMLSFVNAAHLRMRMQGTMGDFDTPPLGDEIVALPELLIERADVDVPMTMRPLLDIAWNAFEQPQCTLFNGQGGWMGL